MVHNNILSAGSTFTFIYIPPGRCFYLRQLPSEAEYKPSIYMVNELTMIRELLSKISTSCSKAHWRYRESHKHIDWSRRKTRSTESSAGTMMLHTNRCVHADPCILPGIVYNHFHSKLQFQSRHILLVGHSRVMILPRILRKIFTLFDMEQARLQVA